MCACVCVWGGGGGVVNSCKISLSYVQFFCLFVFPFSFLLLLSSIS